MVYFKDKEWHLSDETVVFTEGGESKEKPVGGIGKSGWEELAEKNEDVIIVEYNKLEYNPLQLNRLEEINKLSIGDGHGSVVGEYVMDGRFPDLPNHILKDLQFTKMFSIMIGVE